MPASSALARAEAQIEGLLLQEPFEIVLCLCQVVDEVRKGVQREDLNSNDLTCSLLNLFSQGSILPFLQVLINKEVETTRMFALLVRLGMTEKVCR